MTTQSLSDEVSGDEDPEPASPAPPLAPGPAAVLAQCDRLLGEVGRRHHMFSWLRNPEGGADRWLEVDAYYPSQRLVVLCRKPSAPLAAVYRELIPAHGLRLLELDPAELQGDLHTAVRDRLAALERSATPSPATAARQATASARRASTPQAASSRQPAVFAAPAAASAREVADPATRSRSPRRRGAPAKRVPAHPLPDSQATGMLIGLALVVVLGVEFYLGIAKALGSEHWLLAFGLALDLGARMIGTIVAARSAEAGWAWACVIIGSPAVAAASLPKDAPVASDPAPLAGVLALLAMACVLLGLVVG
jgi:hypothetical protein